MRIIKRCLDKKGLLLVLLQLLLTDSRIQSISNSYVLHQPEENQHKMFVNLTIASFNSFRQCEGAARQGLSKPRREASEETSHEETLTLDFCLPWLWELHFFPSVVFCYGSPRKLIYSPIQIGTHNVIIQALNKHLLDILQTVSDHAMSWVERNIFYETFVLKEFIVRVCQCMAPSWWKGPKMIREDALWQFHSFILLFIMHLFMHL